MTCRRENTHKDIISSIEKVYYAFPLFLNKLVSNKNCAQKANKEVSDNTLMQEQSDYFFCFLYC